MNIDFPQPVLFKVGDIATAGIIRNIYTGNRKDWATVFEHKITGKNLGVIIRIDNDTREIITNNRYTGHAVTCFLESKWLDKKIHSIKVTKVNRHSICGEPVEWQENNGE